MLPISDGITIESKPDPETGLAWIDGQAFDTWPALLVTSEGSTHRAISDLHITDKGTIDYDPPKDTKIFQAFLRYFSNSEAAIEILVPFNDTNDFYDLRFLNPVQFNMNFAYSAEHAGTVDSSTFGAFFTYLIATNPNISLVPGLVILSIFALSVIISLAEVIIFIRKKISPRPAFLRSSKLGIIILTTLVASVAVVFLNPLVMGDITSSLRQLSASVNHNFPLSIIYVCILGVLPAFFSLSLFIRSEEFISRAFFLEKVS